MTTLATKHADKFGSIRIEHLEKFEIPPQNQENAEDARWYIDTGCLEDDRVKVEFTRNGVQEIVKHYDVDESGLIYRTFSIIHKANEELHATSILQAENGEDYGIKPVLYAETHLHATGAFVQPVNGSYDDIIRPFGWLGSVHRQRSD